jgi:hypothetical protein
VFVCKSQYLFFRDPTTTLWKIMEDSAAHPRRRFSVLSSSSRTSANSGGAIVSAIADLLVKLTWNLL